ncbi:Cation/H(+) antiporter 15 [Camellia lanceoleosa]|uniref:Cation/H(+) antiporter 15 n=1 Tax=Camellia lanceoleosa TaxID=1840588 RepID=A0ACC0FJT0_9ERIC|nr:Cation/H(+) antiporter 15 [Camellia lanceoleosa]
MTAIITPIVTTIYKPSKRFAPYKQRSIQILKPEAEPRVLVCIHTPPSVPTIINLLEASHPTKNSPFCIYVLHLVELTGRAFAMLIVQSTQGSGSPPSTGPKPNPTKLSMPLKTSNNASLVSPSILSPPSLPTPRCTRTFATWQRTSMLPSSSFLFTKQAMDGGMQVANAAFRSINQNVLANAPCLVGILVDRGLTGSTRLGASNQVSHQVDVLFFGGADDRVALSYAWRMSEHHGISLTVMQFIAGDNAIDPTRVETSAEPSSPTTLTMVTDSDRDKQLDEDYIKEFRARTVNDSIIYKENVVNNGEDTMAAIRSIDNTLYEDKAWCRRSQQG